MAERPRNSAETFKELSKSMLAVFAIFAVALLGLALLAKS